MAITVEQMMSQLDQFGESLNDLQPDIEQLMGTIITDMKMDAPVDTGALRSSIRGEATSNSMTLYMNDYGMFQNYGVGPVSPLNPVEFGISPRPSSEPFYMFKKRILGLRAQSWFSLEQIKRDFGQELGAEIIARTF